MASRHIINTDCLILIFYFFYYSKSAVVIYNYKYLICWLRNIFSTMMPLVHCLIIFWEKSVSFPIIAGWIKVTLSLPGEWIISGLTVKSYTYNILIVITVSSLVLPRPSQLSVEGDEGEQWVLNAAWDSLAGPNGCFQKSCLVNKGGCLSGPLTCGNVNFFL